MKYLRQLISKNTLVKLIVTFTCEIILNQCQIWEMFVTLTSLVSLTLELLQFYLIQILCQQIPKYYENVGTLRQKNTIKVLSRSSLSNQHLVLNQGFKMRYASLQLKGLPNY